MEQSWDRTAGPYFQSCVWCPPGPESCLMCLCKSEEDVGRVLVPLFTGSVNVGQSPGPQSPRLQTGVKVALPSRELLWRLNESVP